MFTTSEAQTGEHVTWLMGIPASQHAVYNTIRLHYTGHSYSHQVVQQQAPPQASSIESCHKDNIISGWSPLTPPPIAPRIALPVVWPYRIYPLVALRDISRSIISMTLSTSGTIGSVEVASGRQSVSPAALNCTTVALASMSPQYT